MDRLSNVLNRFSLNASVFFSGNLCGIQSFDEPQSNHGHLHLLRSGELTVKGDNGSEMKLNTPSVLFFPKPSRHRLFAEHEGGVDLVCAKINYQSTVSNPLTNALPNVLCFDLESSGLLGQSAKWLFEEAFSDLCGREPIVDRLCDILLINVVRHVLAQNTIKHGMIAGLNHPQLSKALTQIHATPENPWSLNTLAETCGMSRSKFADEFKTVVGQSPGDYLTEWRISVAQKLLFKDLSMDFIANSVGYDNGSVLARAFRKKIGMSPTQWLAEERATEQ